MTGRRRPSTPSDLKSRGRRLWAEILDDHDLDVAGLEVLAEACRVADVCEDLRATIDAAGVVDRGSRGQDRVHPALGELRRQRHQLAALLSQLGLDDDGRGVESTATVRARKAARSRWDRHLRAVESPPAKVSRYEHLKGPDGGADRPA